MKTTRYFQKALFFHKTEGAKFWFSVLTELQNRGLKDIFIACIDGLSGFSEAINTVYPKAQVRLLTSVYYSAVYCSPGS
ncbi:MAG: transposase [Endozoicomonas sp.]